MWGCHQLHRHVCRRTAHTGVLAHATRQPSPAAAFAAVWTEVTGWVGAAQRAASRRSFPRVATSCCLPAPCCVLSPIHTCLLCGRLGVPCGCVGNAQAENLLRTGLHISEIVTGFQKAYGKTLEVLEGLATNKCNDVRDKAELVRVLKSVIGAKQFGNEDFLVRSSVRPTVRMLACGSL